MNTHVTSSLVQMEPLHLKQLVAEVKETVATTINMPGTANSSFKAINLWNIRRNGRFVNNGGRKMIAAVSVTHVAF